MRMNLANETGSKPCLFISDNIENITANFLKKKFILEKKPSKGAVRCFTYSLGNIKRLHIRIFEETIDNYVVYAHTEPKPHVDPIFHLKGAILGSEKVQRALNVMIGITKIAGSLMEHIKPIKNNKGELTTGERKKIENIEAFQQFGNELSYLPEQKKELADYEEGCKILRKFFPEYTK